MATKYIRKFKNPVGSKKLRGKKKASQYKSVDRYLNQVYENNKEYIDTHLETYGTKTQRRNVFKNEVKALMDQINPETGKKFSVNQAIDYVQRSTTMRTRGERGFETILTRMKEEQGEVYKKLRKELGWKSKIKSEQSRYVGVEDNYYIYEYRKDNGEVVFVKIKISPNEDMTMDVEVVSQSSYLNKLKLPKYLQDQYSNIKNDEQRKVAEAASSAVEDILRKHGGK